MLNRTHKRLYTLANSHPRKTSRLADGKLQERLEKLLTTRGAGITDLAQLETFVHGASELIQSSAPKNLEAALRQVGKDTLPEGWEMKDEIHSNESDKPNRAPLYGNFEYQTDATYQRIQICHPDSRVWLLSEARDGENLVEQSILAYIDDDTGRIKSETINETYRVS